MSPTAVYIDNEADDARRCQTYISSDSHLIEAELKLKVKIQTGKKNKADSKQNYEKNKRKMLFYTKWKDEFSWLDHRNLTFYSKNIW